MKKNRHEENHDETIGLEISFNTDPRLQLGDRVRTNSGFVSLKFESKQTGGSSIKSNLRDHYTLNYAKQDI
jgi:hypothetical protein